MAQSNLNSEGYGSEMIIFGVKDDEQFYDIVNP